jgi:hypothetical protein
MAQDIATVQRDLANLQKQSKQLSDKIKTETDPNRKAILQKKLIDLNTKKANLNKEMEDIVTSIGAGQELELEGFTKWNKYKKGKMSKLTEAEKLKVKKFAKRLVEKKVLKEGLKLDSWQLAQKISNYFVVNGLIRPNKKTTQLIKDLVNIIDGKGDVEKYTNKF